jgi:hypothetical protein
VTREAAGNLYLWYPDAAYDASHTLATMNRFSAICGLLIPLFA